METDQDSKILGVWKKDGLEVSLRLQDDVALRLQIGPRHVEKRDGVVFLEKVERLTVSEYFWLASLFGEVEEVMKKEGFQLFKRMW